MRSRIILFILFFFSFSCNISTEISGGKVVKIKDGDTIVILSDGKETTIRFADIDCPEKNQPFGMKAKKFVSDLCFSKEVEIKNDGTKDRYGRLIGTVILNRTIINKELVKAGLAWHFKKYSSDSSYSVLEKEARENHIGIWSQPNPIAPWDWRKGIRENISDSTLILQADTL